MSNNQERKKYSILLLESIPSPDFVNLESSEFTSDHNQIYGLAKSMNCFYEHPTVILPGIEPFYSFDSNKFKGSYLFLPKPIPFSVNCVSGFEDARKNLLSVLGLFDYFVRPLKRLRDDGNFQIYCAENGMVRTVGSDPYDSRLVDKKKRILSPEEPNLEMIAACRMKDAARKIF
jgi:hypothetical protein